MNHNHKKTGQSRIASAVCAVLCGLIILTGGLIKSMAKGSVQYFANPDNATELVKLSGNTYAVQFAPCQEIAAVEIYVAKVSMNSLTGLTAELYAWQGGYGQTVKGTPIASQVFEGFDMDVWLSLKVSAPAGEYLLVIKDSKGNVQLTLERGNSDFARTYLNASARDGNVNARVVYKEGGGTLQEISPNNIYLVSSQGTWVATDGLGRSVHNSYTDTSRPGKTVGIFFHTWHSSNAPLGTRNITEILSEHPEIRNDFTSPLWGNAGAYHWNEPLWGYYRSSDEWVLRRQAELLADAGVDAVFFDNTNGTATFMDDVLVLLKVWSEARAEGVNAPKISFMLPMFEYGDTAAQLREIYKKLYKEGIYKDLWFFWKGKPLIVGWPGMLSGRDPLDAEIIDFFNYRVINHAQSQDHVQVMDPDGTPRIMGAIQKEIEDNYILWNWIAVSPQLVNKNPDGTPEEVAVAIAHNWCAETHLTAMNNSEYKVFGRHYRPSLKDYDPRPDAKLYGAYFEEQWEYALSVDPEFVWVTGWNEGVAGRFEDFLGVPNAFPDNFSDEFSRDIEPSKGDLKDHYYYQLCEFIRKYKGVPAASPAAGPVTVDIATGEGWDDVTSVYESYGGDTGDRDSLGYKNNYTGEFFRYTDDSGRNDIVSAKASYDAEYVYFLAETAENITARTDNAWMRLLIEVVPTSGKKSALPSWESFNFIINRSTPESDSLTALERSKGGWSWEKVSDADYRVTGNTIQVRVKRADLGVAEGGFVLNFKWADNNLLEKAGAPDVLELYTMGDTAPGGRFKYQLAAGMIPPKSDGDRSARGCKGALPSGAAAVSAAAVSAGAVCSAAAVYAARAKAKKEKEHDDQ
ncbi:MAG: hypothetical protein ILO53_00815 [Clostridia bacterium]|nr:hypothetical protein [Clostridia bacterium]